jgi:transcriptional regulator with PAS, ATPase and Fis domain
LAYHLQPKLLRVIQEREINKIGGKSVSVDVRVIAATNKNLKELVEKGRFREDLYYRLNVIDIDVPPLRDRKDDIPIIAGDYLNTIKNMGYKNITGISNEAMKLLMNYAWPGNVRELFNIIEKGVNMSKGGALELSDFNKFIDVAYEDSVSISVTSNSTLDDIRRSAEREAIKKMLTLCENNRTKAARNLSITRQSLHAKIKQYGI